MLHIKTQSFRTHDFMNIVLCVFRYLCISIMAQSMVSKGASVQVQASLSNQVAGELSDYRLTINRNISVTGGIITPSSLTNDFSIEIEFGTNYDLAFAQPSSGGYSSFTVDPSNSIIKLDYANISSSTQIIFTLSNVTNPLVTSLYQTISLKIINPSLTIVDQGDLSLFYVSSNITQINNWNQNFIPGNVSTLCTFQFNFIPDVWKNGKMLLTLAFSKYWIRSLQNTSATTIITSSTKCQPTCVISSKATFTEVQFSGLIVNSSLGSVIIKILNILSPPTVERIDIISVSTYDSVYSSVIETGSFFAFSSRPNILQSLVVETKNKIQQQITLSLEMATMNIFGPNDTITLSLGQQILQSRINVSLFNGIVPSYNFDFLSNREIMFSSFTILSSTFSRMAFTVSLEKGLKAVRSTKPIQGNKISIRRNGFLYNEHSFQFSILPAINQIPLSVSVSNNFVNFNSTLSLVVSNIREKVISTDSLSIIIPKEITIVTGSCNPISCIGCLCNMLLANESNNQSIITLSNFPIVGIESISVNLQIKNPIIGGQTISICQDDGQKYRIQCFSGSFPGVKQSALGSRTISFQSSSNVVYERSTYSLMINLTEYVLSQGFMLIYFQKGMYLVNTSIAICYVNDEPKCDLARNSSVDQIVIRVEIMDVSVKIYRVRIENIRNPVSTKPFQFSVQVFTVVLSNGTSQDLLYYEAESSFYSVSQPFKLTNVQASLNPCKNSQPSNLTITIPTNSLPFNPKAGILIDNPNVLNSSILLRTVNQQTLWNETQVNFSVENYISLEPYRYSFLLKTLDLLYDIFWFEITVKTCEPSTLAIHSWKLSGLLGQSGQLNFVYDNLLSIDYMLVELPVEYSVNVQAQSNALNTSKISPRVFKLQLSKVRPVSIQLWNFTHLSLKSSHFKIQTFKTSSTDDKNYLVAQNLNTIIYDLNSATNCLFPCKICSSSNSSVCLDCYQRQWTENYLLVNSSCNSVCQSGSYLSSTTQICQRCNLACLTCEETKCVTCVQFYYFHNGSCLTDCPSKFFPISLNQTCSSCTYPCDSCINSSTCISCVNPFYLTSSGKCVANCEQNEFPIDKVCRKCQVPCETCSQQLNNCTKCLSGFYFNSGSCLTVCPSPLVPAIINGNNICTSCISPCLTCSLDPSNCTSCISPFNLYLQSCRTTCPQSSYQNSNLCLPCPSQCLVCSSAINCSICAKSYKLHNSRCLWRCPLMYFSKTIVNEENQLVNGTEMCSSCTNDNRCISCQNESSCTLCSSEYYLVNSVCVGSCPLTTFADVNICRNCSTSCLYCVSQRICEVCSSTTNLYQENCIISCPNTTISIEMNVSISNLVGNTSFLSRTKTCAPCGSIHSNCLVCTNISCTSCKQSYVMDFDRSCRISCSQGYINLNNSGFCLRCEAQCIGCSKMLNNCTQCSNGFVFNILSVNGSQMRQCISACPQNQIAFQNQCVSCRSPCQTCIQTPIKCTSCITFNSNNNQSYYLFNYSCLTQCPENHYAFQNGCVECQDSCQLCVRDGCLRCATGYFTFAPFTIQNSANSSTQYYNCYSTCPSNLPFVTERGICTKCSQNCLSCNSDKCLQCTEGYFIYGHYCIVECPLPLVNYSRSCVNQSDIPVTPQPEPPQEPIISIVQPSYFSMPVPFSIGMFILWFLCLLSKCQHPHSHLSISSYSLCSIASITAFVYYLVTFILQTSNLNIPTTLLLASLILNYIQNLVFIILTKFTLFRDPSFSKITKVRTQYKVLLLLFSTIFTHSNYIIFFSRLFDFSVFKLYVQNINSVRIINYLWGGQVLVYLMACTAGILRLLMENPDGYTFSQKLQHFYQCIDLIVVSFVMFLLSILNFKKPKSTYMKEEDWVSTQSTKKVIFDQSSNGQLMENSYESREEFNICGKNFRVANEQTLLDQMIFPEESANKFSMSSRDPSDNYDNIFNDNLSLEEGINSEILQFKESIDQKVVDQKYTTQQQINRNEVAEKFGLSRTVDIILREEEMGQNLEQMKTISNEQNDFDLDNPKAVSAITWDRLRNEVRTQQLMDEGQLFEGQLLVSQEINKKNHEAEKQDDDVSQEMNKQNEETAKQNEDEGKSERGEVFLQKVSEQSEQQQNNPADDRVDAIIQSQQEENLQEAEEEALGEQKLVEQLGSIDNKNTGIQLSINQRTLSQENPLENCPSKLSNSNQINFDSNTNIFKRQSVKSPHSNSLKSNSKQKYYQSSPKFQNQLTPSITVKSSKINPSPILSTKNIKSLKLKLQSSDISNRIFKEKRRYQKSPQKEVYLAGQNFASDRQLSKLKESSRISGLQTLFENNSQEQLFNKQKKDTQSKIHKTHQVQGTNLCLGHIQDQQRKGTSDCRISNSQSDFEQNIVLSPQKSLLLIEQHQNNPKDLIGNKQPVSRKKSPPKRQQQNNSLNETAVDGKQCQNVKFYLIDGTENNNMKSNRKSKSFSPNNFKNKIIDQKEYIKNDSRLKMIQSQRGEVKGKLKPMGKIHDNKSNRSRSLIKSPQYEIIDYKRVGQRKERENNIKQGVGQVIYEIERKQRVKSRQKKLHGIYANKNSMN